MKICVVTDNNFLFENFYNMVAGTKEEYVFYCSKSNYDFMERYGKSYKIDSISLKDKDESFFKQYDLFLSLHCKQIFPAEMVKYHRCINIHPGFNPYNRGWFPQIFSIINKFPVGVTIHEMDEKLDHGPIIVQKEVEIYDYDTAFDVYERIQQVEIQLLKEWLDRILYHQYVTSTPFGKGNINSKGDFDRLCEIRMDKMATVGEVIDYLRAMTFDGYHNAFFRTQKGEKIYVTIGLKKESEL